MARNKWFLNLVQGSLNIFIPANVGRWLKGSKKEDGSVKPYMEGRDARKGASKEGADVDHPATALLRNYQGIGSVDTKCGVTKGTAALVLKGDGDMAYCVPILALEQAGVNLEKSAELKMVSRSEVPVPEKPVKEAKAKKEPKVKADKKA